MVTKSAPVRSKFRTGPFAGGPELQTGRMSRRRPVNSWIGGKRKFAADGAYDHFVCNGLPILEANDCKQPRPYTDFRYIGQRLGVCFGCGKRLFFEPQSGVPAKSKHLTLQRNFRP